MNGDIFKLMQVDHCRHGMADKWKTGEIFVGFTQLVLFSSGHRQKAEVEL